MTSCLPGSTSAWLHSRGSRRCDRAHQQGSQSTRCSSAVSSSQRESQQNRLRVYSGAEPDQLAERFFQEGQYPDEGLLKDQSLPDALGEIESAFTHPDSAVSFAFCNCRFVPIFCACLFANSWFWKLAVRRQLGSLFPGCCSSIEHLIADMFWLQSLSLQSIALRLQ